MLLCKIKSSLRSAAVSTLSKRATSPASAISPPTKPSSSMTTAPQPKLKSCKTSSASPFPTTRWTTSISSASRPTPASSPTSSPKKAAPTATTSPPKSTSPPSGRTAPRPGSASSAKKPPSANLRHQLQPPRIDNVAGGVIGETANPNKFSNPFVRGLNYAKYYRCFLGTRDAGTGAQARGESMLERRHTAHNYHPKVF